MLISNGTGYFLSSNYKQTYNCAHQLGTGCHENENYVAQNSSTKDYI